MENEINHLNEIYQQILHNVVRFLEKIEVTNDIREIYVFLKYMITNSYLSKNEITNADILRDIQNLEDIYLRLDNCGSLIFFGCNKCRHIADFYRRIYTILGFENSQLFLYIPHLKIQLSSNNSKNDLVGKEDNINKLISSLNLKSLSGFNLEKTIDNLKLNIIYKQANPKELRFGNHTVNIILDKQGKTHIYDIQYPFYTKDNQDIFHFFYTENLYLPAYLISETFYNIYLKGITLLENYPNINKQEETTALLKLSEICQSYTKEFNSFYHKNLKNYKEANSCIKRMLKKYNS